MSSVLLQKKIEDLARSWESFKSMNDRRLSEVEKRQVADPITIDQLSKLNTEIDTHKSKIESLENDISVSKMQNDSLASKNLYSGVGASYEYKEAFLNYIRKGSTSNIDLLNSKSISGALNSVVDQGTGYLVTSAVAEFIASSTPTISTLRNIANVQEIGQDNIEIIKQDTNLTAEWFSTTDNSISDVGTATPVTIQTHQLSTQPKATQKFLDDIKINPEHWLGSYIGDAFSREENSKFINGDGNNSPKGILPYFGGGDKKSPLRTATSNSINGDDLLKLVYQTSLEYTTNAHFVMSRVVLKSIRELKDTTGRYIWSPSLGENMTDTIFGYPVQENNAMPNTGSAQPIVLFGDFKRGYLILDKYGVTILRDNMTEKPFIKFYATKRVGGDVINLNALEALSFKL